MENNLATIRMIHGLTRHSSEENYEK
jgi:hypothetical protein